jgi:hypothetical protein
MPHTPKVILPKDKEEPSHKRLGMRLEKRVFCQILGVFNGMGKFTLATEETHTDPPNPLCFGDCPRAGVVVYGAWVCVANSGISLFVNF